MKKSATYLLFILFFILGLIGNAFAQAPEGIIYQAEARDENGNPIRNQTLDVLIKIIQDDASGWVVWEDLHEVTTSEFGLFVLIIGHGTNTGGTVFENIDWGNHLHLLNVQVKTKNNSTWIDMGTQQLLSVPYALHSKTAETITGTITETDPLFTAWDKSNGISITESQISDLDHFTTDDETDPVYSVAPAASIIDAGSGAVITDAERTKLLGIAEGAEVNVQSDWDETDNTKDAYIANKPANVSTFTNDAGYLTTETNPSVPSGTQIGDMQYWNGTAWVTLPPGEEGQSLNMLDGVPTWQTPGVKDVENPTTGKTWMDRNLGAAQVAASSIDANAYGDLYQWGRAADLHEKRSSRTTLQLSLHSDTPGHSDFITVSLSPYDWRSPQNDNLWQGVNGINNPCPDDYRLPTEVEWEAERTSWSSNDAAGAFTSPLKLPMAGRRLGDGLTNSVGSYGSYWSSSVAGTDSRMLGFYSSFAAMVSFRRANGLSVRCLKDDPNMPAKNYLNIDFNPAGKGEVSGAGAYEAGEAVSITAVANAFWKFVEWTGDIDYVDDPLAANTTVTMPAYNVTLTANFEEYYDGWPIDTETEIVEVTSPTTGKTWMDRNLGASRAATSNTDAEAYGDLYQWGRAADGHQKRNSATTSTLSGSYTPGHGNFIYTSISPYDWRSPQNDDLWGINGINDPCPSGYRLPRIAEWEAERKSWSSNDADGAFASPLKLPVAGFRAHNNGFLGLVGSAGSYWSSTVNTRGTDSWHLVFGSSNAAYYSRYRAEGNSVRCIKD